MIGRLIASIRGQTDATSADEAARLVDRARAEHADAERNFAAARGAYDAALFDADDTAALKARGEVTKREVAVDRAAAAITLAEQAHAVAVEREAEATRVRRYAEAEAKTHAAIKVLGEYEGHAKAIRAILAAVAESNVAVAAANADLPSGTAPLVPAEKQVRGLPGVPTRELSRERLPDAWHFTGEFEIWGEVLPQFWPSIKKTSEGKGILETTDPETKSRRNTPVEMRKAGIRVRYIPEKAGVMPEALHTQISLPGLHAGEPNIWNPVGNMLWGYEIGEDGLAVLEAVAARETAPARTREEMQSDGAPQERIERPAAQPGAKQVEPEAA